VILPSGVTATATSGTHTTTRPLSIAGTLNITSGSLNLTTTSQTPQPLVRVEAGGVLSMNNAGMSSSGLASVQFENFGTLSISNASNFSIGTALLVDTRAGATTTFNNVTVPFSAATVAASGTWNISSSTLPSMTIANQGTLNFVTGSTLTGTIANDGALNVNGGTVTVQATVTNNGTMSVNGGTLSAGALVNNGTFAVNAGALAGSNPVANNGIFTVSGGATASIGTFSATASSTTSASGSMTITSVPTSIEGTLNIAGSFSNQGGIITLAGTTNLTGTLAGDAYNLTGTFNWNAGTMSTTVAGRLTVASGATLNIQGTSAKTLARQIDNFGAVNWTAGNIIANSGLLNNLPTGVLAISATATFSRGSGIAAIQNLGVINKTGTGTTTLGPGAAMYNAATTNILTGTLALNGGGLHSGVFITSPGATLSFAGVHLVSGACGFEGPGTVTVTGGSLTVTDMLSPSGSLIVSGGTVSVGQTSMLANLTLSGGSLGGAADMQVNGALVWTGGTLTGTGTTIVLGSAAATIGGGITARVLERSLVLSGASTITGGLTIAPTGVLTLLGATTVATDVSGNVLNNAGTIVVQGQQTVTLPVGMTLNNTGTVEARVGTFNVLGGVTQLSGTTLSGGTYMVGEGSAIGLPAAGITSIGAGATVRLAANASFTSLAGLTTLAGQLALGRGRMQSVTPSGGALTISGTIDVGERAALNVTGGVTLTGTARTRLGLDPTDLANGLGRISATGAASVAGSLVVTSATGIDPAAVNFFAAVSSPSLTGGFATVSLPTASSAFKYVVVSGDSGVSVLFTLKTDFNNDGNVDPDDLADFIGAFFSGGAGTDFNGDGTVDPDDLADYIGAYFG